jgi:hypothetical protein
VDNQKENTTNNKKWTPEEDAILRQFWGSISTKEIGAKMGRVKNSIISRAHRIGLPNYSPIMRREAQVRNQQKAVRVLKNRNTAFFKVKLGPVKQPTMRLLDIKPINGTGILFFDLKVNSCRWTMPDEKHFCGHPVQKGQSFCPDHYSVAYKPVPKRNLRYGYR